MFLSVTLVTIFLNLIICQKVEEKWNFAEIKNNDKIYEISHIDTNRVISNPRTFIPSFRVILLEISLMAISVFLVNSLENYIKTPKNKPKHRKIDDEDIYRNIKKIIRNMNE